MNLKENQQISTVSRQAEEENLLKILKIIQNNMINYGNDVSKMREQIDEMLEHFHDDNPELINQLENTITMHDHLKRALERNEKAQKKPYFGRVVFRDETSGQEESLYIGRGGILEDATHIAVVDWRAPVANTYYENGLGKCNYPSPDGSPIPIDLTLKRTYEIEDGKLLNYYDTEVIANDDLLTKYLSKNKQAVLGEIVATIQKEQNDIIRRSPYHNCLVQGVAGSGKTTVAMHRISYILYNYPDRFKPEDFYIVGSNRILLNYITGVLPDLDVYGVKQMTMEQLFIRLLYEDWNDKKYGIKELDRTGEEAVKGTLKWFRDLEAYCNQLENDTISFDDIYLEPMQFVEGYEKGEFGVFDRSRHIGSADYRSRSIANKKQSVLLVDFESVEQYVSQNPGISIQTKINTLNDRLIMKINDEFLGKGVKYTEAERKAILKAYRGKYGPSIWKISIFDMYRDFLNKQIERAYKVKSPFFNKNTADQRTDFDVYDLAALAYLYKRVKETEVISEAHHVVIDEAQDYGMMAYSVLKFCIKDCTYTIMGDVSQNIHFGYGLNDWENLKKLYMTTDRASFDILKKSYRNTIEISNFATSILHHGQFSVYPVEPIIRHGNPVEVIDITKSGDAAVENLSGKPFIQKAAEICKAWQKKGVETIAIVCRNHEEASGAAMELSRFTEIIESDLEKAEFGKGIMVLPVEYTKGLEFDAVLIWKPTREAYPTDDGHAKLLYVAATRALHELCVLHDGNLTGLIADPIPERETKMYSDNLLEASDRARKLSGRDSCMPDGTFIQDALKSGGEKITKPKAVAAFKKTNISDMPGTTTSARYSTYTASKPVAVKNTTGTSFGDIPVTEILSPPGHPQIDLSVRWVDKRSDGIYLHSRYGVLRISPVHSNAIRITFAKGNTVSEGAHRKIALNKLNRFCRFKDSSKMIEIVNDEICLQVDKSTGAIRYMNRDKKLLLEERGNACRQLEVSSKGVANYRLYLKWQKDEQIYGHRIADKLSESLRGKARYISHSAQSEDLPLLISDKGYGLLMASEGPAFGCDVPAYGSYLYAENAVQIDFYFLIGKNTEEILSVYETLLGKR